MDPLKEAFNKIKEDIKELREEIVQLNKKINALTTQKISTHENNQYNRQTDKQTHNIIKQPLKASYNPNLVFSTGNQGVPTDKQTNRQTDRHNVFQVSTSKIDQLSEILESLDSLKKEIRLKFKRLTPQEIMVFSTLYTLEDQNTDEITHSLLAKTLNLSESSIRDYLNKLIKKGIPIDKIKKNNKTILLKISSNLKKMASLDTILKLRDI
jgi:biotin operon repressor